MKKRELEKTLMAASRIAGEFEFFLIGSQAVHAYCRRPPVETLLSQECDIYPKNRPEMSNLLDAELGRGSPFARRHGYYADVVTPEIASLPTGWQRRLKTLKVGRVVARCLEGNDLVVSKLAAGRLKDLEFVGALLQMGVVRPDRIRRRIQQFPVSAERMHIRSRLNSVLHDLRQQREHHGHLPGR